MSTSKDSPEKEKALETLRSSLSKQEISAEFVQNDEDWKAYLEDADFWALMTEYKA